jgi:hypothetical protein
MEEADMAGAVTQENQIEVTDDYLQFFNRVCRLSYPQLEWLDLPFDDFAGVFVASKLQILQRFCTENPTYHMISITGPGRYENRYVPGCRGYLIGSGDKNPTLVLNALLHKNLELVLEEGFAKALTIVSQVDRSDEGE